MQKIISTLFIGALLCVQPLYANEESGQKGGGQKESEATSLWDSLRKKIETFTPKKKLSATTAVGGVRGALVESEDLYWKGERIAEEINPKELKDFDNALVLYEAGNSDGAKNAFGKFVTDYPESILVSDANKALELLGPTQ